jgi:hypothetical protein
MPRDSAQVKIGPGRLFSAPLGTAEPTDLATAWAAAWIDIGYTESGHTFNFSFTAEDITVAEELDPIRVVPTGRAGSVDLSMAQITLNNLKRAFNGGTITVGAGGTFSTYEPPEPSAQVRSMLGWESDDAQERLVWRQVIQTGNIAIPRGKAPAKTLIPVSFKLEKPTGATPFKHIAATALVGT